MFSVDIIVPFFAKKKELVPLINSLNKLNTKNISVKIIIIDDNTKENLDTGSIYKNADVDGTLFGIGLHKATDSGFFYRVSGEFTDYDTINLTSTTAADATTTTLNKVKADIDTMAFKVSVGKAF